MELVVFATAYLRSSVTPLLAYEYDEDTRTLRRNYSSLSDEELVAASIALFKESERRFGDGSPSELYST
jgi:hypothetical protein